MAGEYVLSVILQAQNKAGNAISSFVSSLGPIGVGVAAVSGALIGIGVASVKMAGEYDAGMRRVQALTGSSNAEMKSYDASLKSLAMNAGVAPTKLTDGLYNVLSASYKGADAINVLTLATEDSKIGMTSATVTTDALTNVLRSFGTQSKDITRVNGEMLETVTLGKATFEQYASTIVKSASSASQFHVSMETMNAAWSTMTSSGIRAAQASTDFQQSLKVMYGNIGTVTKSLNKSGIAFNETKFNTMDYGHKVQYLNNALEQANAKHVKVTGVTLQAAQAVSTISKHIGDYNSNLATLSNKQEMARKTSEAWKITQGGFNQTMDRLKATLDVVMLSIGQKLLPVLTDLANQIIPVVQQVGDWLIKSGALDTIAKVLTTSIKGIVDVISTLVDWGFRLSSFFHDNQFAMDVLKSVIVGVSVAMSIWVMSQIPAMIVALGAWATAQWLVLVPLLATAAPFIAIGLIVAAVVLGIILVIQHWGAIMDWISGKTEQLRIKQEVTQEKQKITAINKTEEQKKGVLKQLEDERTQVLAKLKNMANGADKTREEMKLKSIDHQIATTKANIKELDKERAQHLATLKKLKADDLEARKDWYTRANDATTAWFDSWKGILVKWYNNANNTITKWFDSWKGVLIRWYNNANDAVTRWFSSWSGALTRWVQDGLNHAGQMKDGFLAKLGQLKDQAIAKAQQTVAGIANFFINLPGQALQWGANLLQSFIDGIASKIPNLQGIATNAIQSVKNILGFHSPAKEGPGSDADIWAVNLMNMYISGIQGGLPGIKVAVNKAAELMKAGFTGDANQLYQKINQAQYQLYLDKKAQVDAKYRQREAKHYETWLADQHKRYEKYLEARQKALDKYDHEKHHKKAFHYHDFKMGKFHALKETLPKFTGLALGAFANQTNILDPDLGNGAPMALPASSGGSGGTVHIDNSVNLTIHGSVVDHTKLMNEIQKQQDKQHRMSGLHTSVTSGGKAR